MKFKLAKQLAEANFPGLTIPYTNPDGSDDPRNGTTICDVSLSELIDFTNGEHIREIIEEDWVEKALKKLKHENN